MAKNYFNRYVWLIDTIQQHGYITLSDLSKQWQRSALNEDGSPLPERTFFNHRDAILDTFGIEIKFDKTLGYHIPEGSGDMDGIRNWLLASLSVNNLISESAGMRDRIILENIPSGQRYLSLIIRAMKEGKKLEMRYLKFEDNKEIHIDVSPLCVKVFKQRWYMLALPGSKGSPCVYALDRISSLQETRQDFHLPKKFKPEEYFSTCFGIVHDDDVPAETVRLKVWAKQRNYFRTLPLHPSQEEVETQEDWSIFEYQMAPTWDLEMELLQYNDQIEVLAPQCLRDMMIEHAWNMLHLYEEV